MLKRIGILLSLWVVGAVAGPSRPNVVFILADDLGYGELGCYGQEKIKTPHIDQLAAEGVRFTQHYTGAPVCAPARCVLMTGRHLGHAEIRGNRDSGQKGKFPGQWPLSDEALTLAEVLKAQGYSTGAFGKWGLGPSGTSGSPVRQGFDYFFGYNCQRNAHSYYPPFLDRGELRVPINEPSVPGHARQPEGDVRAVDYRGENYAPDLILNEALQFIDTHKDGPFFLYLPLVEPHVAMQPPQEWLDQYPKEWDDPSEDAPGVYRGQNGYLPHDRPRAAYAAMISDMDAHVGAVMERLRKHGLDSNTLVIFTSDNGATHGGADRRFHVGGVDAWFFNSSGGLRGYKGSCYEGGIRVPCIVRWPGQVPAGGKVTAPSYFPDWFPTLGRISGADLSGVPHDGVDLWPAMDGRKLAQRGQPMIWDFHDYGGIVAIRDGRWKAVRRGMRRTNPQPWELYDLEHDPGETRNVATEHPGQVEAMADAWLRNRTVEPDFPLPAADALTQGGAETSR
ncbi:arylsulfatase [Sulfuriroseicoccus oceanibius]|uniref:Arylsulfatase n=1 Tax=Sulfuriroseicoccus oceanibius TaxID=2707525 RepID=A0A6B3L6D2_9BACT|nr:arylsulfatase [Sulfuriroseicoccus oceanibius]QQL46157.1 arylsulfatase [Sulfuriroseicoccus oceanibius]